MGMITRVRGRLQSISKLNPQYQEEKIAQSVCLLTVVLVMPHVSHSTMPLLLALFSWLTTYSCLAAPLLVSAKGKCPAYANDLHHLVEFLTQFAKKWVGPVTKFLKKIYAPIDRFEKAFFKMHNLFTLLNQVTFFIICDRVINTGHNATTTQSQVTSLYSLMFYNVISYCVCYVKELIEKEDWSPYVHITETSNVKHLAMTATKVVLELTKAITFIITVIFMLLVFGLEQKLEHYHPTTTYTVITWFFYMATEKVFIELFKSLLQYLQLDIFESLEALYTPVLLNGFVMFMTFIFTLPLIIYGQFKLVIVAFYFNIYLKCKDAYLHCFKDLIDQRNTLVPFRHATQEELSGFDDICAVCLSPMRLARITPCHHLFHANCLRQCLKTSNNCPICKQEYKMC